MGFELQGFIGARATLRGWQELLPSAIVCKLSGDLALVPLTAELRRDLEARLAADATVAGSAPPADRAQAWAARASAAAPVVFVDAFEFGDAGHEDYTLWVAGHPEWTTGSEHSVRSYFQDHLRVDVGPAFDIGKYRGETAAEKWARLERSG
jgi:hypothetical protein